MDLLQPGIQMQFDAPVPVVSCYQLAVVYTKGSEWRLPQQFCDRIPAGQREDGEHPHRKTNTQMQYIVEMVSEAGQLVVDPCAGSFKTAEACWRTNRLFCGGDLNPACLGMARKTFSTILPLPV